MKAPKGYGYLTLGGDTVLIRKEDGKIMGEAISDMLIVCDIQERNSHIPEALESKATVKIKKLPVGDYKYKWLVVERKPDYQFIKDWHTKQLDKQIANMIRWCEKHNCTPCLISENDGKVNIPTQMTIEKHLRTLGKDIWCLRSYGSIEGVSSTVATMIYYFEKIKRKNMIQGFKRPCGVVGKKDDQVNFVCGFYKVDEVTAVKLLSHYGTIKRVVNNVRHWSKDIEGIGPTIQKRATDLLLRRFIRI